MGRGYTVAKPAQFYSSYTYEDAFFVCFYSRIFAKCNYKVLIRVFVCVYVCVCVCVFPGFCVLHDNSKVIDLET